MTANLSLIHILRVSQAERERAAKEKNAAPEIRRMVMEDGAAIAELEYSLFQMCIRDRQNLSYFR